MRETGTEHNTTLYNNKTHYAKHDQKNSTSGHFHIFSCVYKPIEKNKIPVVRGLKTKRKKLHVEQKVKKKTVSFENSFIFLILDFCTKGFSGFTNAENDV